MIDSFKNICIWDFYNHWKNPKGLIYTMFLKIHIYKEDIQTWKDK